MDGRINVAEAPEIMVSRRPPNTVEKANPAWMPRPNSPLEITPHKTRVVRDGAMSAIVILHMATQGGCAAITNVVEGFPLWAGEYPLPQSQKVISVSAEDIAQFQPMLTPSSGRYILAPSTISI